VRVILADDAVLFRDALAEALEARGHEVVGQVKNADDLLIQVETHRPDIALIDIRMPPSETAGLDAAIEIRRQGKTAVLLLSHYIETVDAARLLGDDAAGVGYLLKDRVADVVELDAAMSRVVAGGSVVDPAVVAAWLGRPRTRGPLDTLTARESEVLALMAEGRSNTAIAAALTLTVRTVEAHVASIFSKLGLEPATTDHRRVLAVITWLRTTD
jgi:DNA-binding NarL/FixJ family response regulator